MRIAHIDADVLAVQAAIVNQKAVRWDPEEEGESALWTLHAFEADGESTFASMVETLMEKVGADKAILAFSDKVNWRKSILPTYKANRANTIQPLLRKHLTAWAQTQYECFVRPTLEGDDVLGILATMKRKKGEEVVTVSIDKDFKTVPGMHFNFNTNEFFEITQEEADWWHLYQTLMGDATDGYSGCPGMGEGAAKEFLDDPYVWVPYQHTFKSGPRKDQQEQRWQKEALGDRPIWEGVVSCFEKAGLCEEEALVQARVARICRSSDYDFQTKQVKLWTPKVSK